MTMLTLALTCATAQAHVTKIPKRCTHHIAPRLCAIHFHRHRTNMMRAKMNQHAIPYHWVAERYPARRDTILTYWMTVQAKTAQRLRNYHPYDRNLLCIHHYEGSWTAYNPAGYYGGLQMDWSFMRHWGSDMLSKYGGRDARAWSPLDQLIVGTRAVNHIGYGPWPNTARMCGLL